MSSDRRPSAVPSAADTAVDHAAAATNKTAVGNDAQSAPAKTPSSTAHPSVPTVVTRYASGSLVTFSRPFSRFNLVPVGGRSTAVRLRDGSVWCLASTPLDDETRSELTKMGEVKYIVAPDFVHHLYVGEYADAYPKAKVIGVEGLPAKRPDIKWTGAYGQDPETTKYGFEDEVQARYFPTFANKDVVFHHKDSKSLIVADLIFNLPANEQYSTTPKGRPTSPIPFVSYLSSFLTPGSALHRSFLWMSGAGAPLPSSDGAKGSGGNTQERRARFARDASEVASWSFERIIPCHGDVYPRESQGAPGDAKKAWITSFAKYLHEDGSSRF